MSSEKFTDERLRAEFMRMDGAADRGAGCPPPERLVMASRGELARAEREEVFLHLTRCPACAAAWRAARELASGDETAGVQPAPRRILRPGWTRLAAAAVLVALVGAGVYFLYPDQESEPLYRTQEHRWLQSVTGEEQVLDRENFLLRWTAGPDGTFYDIQVLSARLDLLKGKNGLDRPEYLVPAEALEGVPSGSRILWQVTARLPDGRRLESETFITGVD
jgi:hypothetical protein